MNVCKIFLKVSTCRVTNALTLAVKCPIVLPEQMTIQQAEPVSFHTRIDRTKLICLTVLSNTVYGMIVSLAGAIVPQLSSRLSIGAHDIANIFLAQALGMMAASVSAGPLVDNRGKKAGLLLALALIGLAMCGLPVSGTQPMVFACMTMLGVGGGILSTTTNTLISDIFPGKRATLLTLLKVFFGLGGFAMPFLGASLFKGNTLALCYVVAGLVIVSLILAMRTAMPPASGHRAFRLAEAEVLTGQPLLYVLCLMVFLYVACEVGTFNWLAKHLIAQGLSQPTALRVTSGFAIGLIVGRVAFAGILMKIRASTATLFGSAFMMVTTVAMIESSTPGVAGTTAFLAGVAMASMFPALLAMTGDQFPRMTGTALGLVLTCGWAGSAASAKLIGGLAGPTPAGIKRGLLILPAFSAMLLVMNLVLLPMLKAKAQTNLAPAVAASNGEAA
jgi:fucose permease